MGGGLALSVLSTSCPWGGPFKCYWPLVKYIGFFLVCWSLVWQLRQLRYSPRNISLEFRLI